MPTKKTAKPAAKPVSAAKPKAAKGAEPEGATKVFTTADMVEAYHHFLAAAQALPADDVPARSGDTEVARHNISRGVDAIRPHLDDLKRRMPLLSASAILELPALALGLIHAEGRVPDGASTGEINAALAKVAGPREDTLSYLEIAARRGLVPEARVRAIRMGKGKLDNARDCVDIAGVFHEFKDVLKGKHPFTDKELKEMAATGTWLVERITPMGTVKASQGRDPAALICDRFWKLIEDRHNGLRTAGVAIWGIKHVDEHVPSLFARSGPAAPAAKKGGAKGGAKGGGAASAGTPAAG